MKQLNIIIFILTISLFTSCKKEEKSLVNENNIFENKVFEQIFLETVDSTYKDGRIYLRKFPVGTDFETIKGIIKKDTSKLVFAVDIEKYKINFKKFETKKFIFKDISEFPKENKYQIWETKYDFEFAGAFLFSKIQFDKKKENGSLKVSYNCGTKCGWYYQVLIKKVNNNWVIDKVTVIGMS